MMLSQQRCQFNFNFKIKSSNFQFKKLFCHTASNSVSSSLQISQYLAWIRSQKNNNIDIGDEISGLFLENWNNDMVQVHNEAILDELVSVKYLDQLLLNALNLAHEVKGEYKQVVLLGDGLDTRAFRLPIPRGTIIFCVAPSEVNSFAKEIQQKNNLKVDKGNLFRRINWDFSEKKCEELLPLLQKSGYRADKLSIWIVQGLHLANYVSEDQIQNILTQVTSSAAFESLIFGQLPYMTIRQGQEFIAKFGLAGSVLSPKTIKLEQLQNQQAFNSTLNDDNDIQNRTSDLTFPIFSTQQKQLSLVEVETYTQHMEVAEELDEDFFGNFS